MSLDYLIGPELDKTSNAIKAAGIPQPEYFRPPFGDTNDDVNTAVGMHGMQTVLWTVDTLDWNNPSDPSATPPYATEQSIINAVLNGATNGSISLMHDLAGDVSYFDLTATTTWRRATASSSTGYAGLFMARAVLETGRPGRTAQQRL